MAIRWSDRGRLLMIFCFMAAGCAPYPEVMLSWNRQDAPPPLALATERGRYAVDVEGDELFSVVLEPGDRYGFRKTSDSSMQALLKRGGTEQTHQLPAARSYWWRFAGQQ